MLHSSPYPWQPVLQLHRRPRANSDQHRWSGRWRARTPRCRTPPPAVPLRRRSGGRCHRRGDPGGLFSDGLRWVLLGPGHRCEQQDRPAPGWLRPCRSRANTSTSAGESSAPGVIAGVDVMGQFKQRPLTETVEIPLLWKGILDFLPSGFGGPGWHVGVRPLVSSVRSLRSLLDHRWLRPAARHGVALRTAFGLVCPLASLAARPPGLRPPAGCGFETLASLTPQPPGARCSTTGGCGPAPAYGGGSRRSLRRLNDRWV